MDARLDDLFDALRSLGDIPDGGSAATSIRQPAALRRAAHLAVDLGMDVSVTAATNTALAHRVQAFARQRAMALHLAEFPQDRPALAAVARRRVHGSGHPAEPHPEIIEHVAGWVERREPDWALNDVDATVDDVLRITEVIAAGGGLRTTGAA